MNQSFVLRSALPTDIPGIEQLIGASVRGLSVGYYDATQIDHALTEIFGVDSRLIDDGTYLVIESDSHVGPVAAGGWSRRRTLFGGDQMKDAQDPLLDAATEPARIRAFFVHPEFARRGLARMLFDECERRARAAGFREFSLAATLPGVPLYKSLGFEEAERFDQPMRDSVVLPLIRMTRPIAS